MPLVDLDDAGIERDIADPFGRTPHFVVDEDEWARGETAGVLYWPDRATADLIQKDPSVTRIGWSARAFRHPDEAAAFVETLAG